MRLVISILEVLYCLITVLPSIRQVIREVFPTAVSPSAGPILDGKRTLRAAAGRPLEHRTCTSPLLPRPTGSSCLGPPSSFPPPSRSPAIGGSSLTDRSAARSRWRAVWEWGALMCAVTRAAAARQTSSYRRDMRYGKEKGDFAAIAMLFPVFRIHVN